MPSPPFSNRTRSPLPIAPGPAPRPVAADVLSHRRRTAPAPFDVVDVRAPDAFARGHLAGSGHLPLDRLRERRGELPPRDRPLVVVADTPEDARHGAQEIAAAGWQDVGWLDAALAEVPGGLVAGDPPARLWRPAPFLEAVLPALPRGRALDLAAGVGREAAFLALHGFEVEAWDHDDEALRRAGLLADGVGVRLTTRRVDLEQPGLELPAGAFAVVTVFRFLHRALFPAIERAVAPGGCLVYETFRRGQERHGHPLRPRFLLEPGELAGAFPTLRAERYEETDPPGGPVMARLLARRPG